MFTFLQFLDTISMVFTNALKDAVLIWEVIHMLAAVQGVIRNNTVQVQNEDISPYNGRVVTIIINEEIAEPSKQDKSRFFDTESFS